MCYQNSSEKLNVDQKGRYLVQPAGLQSEAPVKCNARLQQLLGDSCEWVDETRPVLRSFEQEVTRNVHTLNSPVENRCEKRNEVHAFLAQHPQVWWITLLYLCMAFPSNTITFKRSHLFVARKMAQWLRSLAAFLEDHFLAPTSVSPQSPVIPAPGNLILSDMGTGIHMLSFN